jgi:V8-like Glu-specific endopeptidase
MAETQTDIRQIAAPWADPNVSGIAQLNGQNATHTWTGTAELIDPEYVLTAAHCLEGATAISVTFGASPNQSATANQKLTYQVMAACIPTQHAMGGSRYDFGVARLAKKVTDSQISVHRIRPVPALGWTGFSQMGIYLIGYPATRQGVTPSETPTITVGHMYWQPGTPYRYDASTNTASYQMDTRCGHSGGPIIKADSNEIVGVHVRFTVLDGKQVGQAMMLTQPVQQWIQAAMQALKNPTAFVTQL